MRRGLRRRALAGVERRLLGRADRSSRQRQVRVRARDGAGRSCRARSWSTTSTSSIVSSARSRRAPAVRAPRTLLVRVTPDVRRRDAREDLHRSGRLQVRFLDRGRPAAIARIDGIDGLVLAGLHAHVGSQLLELYAVRRAVAELAELGEFPVMGPRRRSRGRLHRGPAAPARDRGLRRRARRRGARARAGAPGERLLIEPGRALCANAGVTLYTVESVKQQRLDAGSPSTAACPTTCARCSTARRYEAHVADRFGGSTLRARRQALRVGDVIVREALLDDPRAGRRDRDARDGRLRIRDGQQLQRRPAPAGDLLPRRRRARGRQARDASRI